jgi:hypothetical protein
MKKVITNGTQFLTNRFGSASLTDNINIANVYQVDEQNENLLLAYSKKFDTVLTFEPLTNYSTPFNF